MKKEIFYSVKDDKHNNSNVFFFESKKLAMLDQKWQYGLGIRRFKNLQIGSIVIKSETTIQFLSEIKTKQNFIDELQKFINNNNDKSKLYASNYILKSVKKI